MVLKGVPSGTEDCDGKLGHECKLGVNGSLSSRADITGHTAGQTLNYPVSSLIEYVLCFGYL